MTVYYAVSRPGRPVHAMAVGGGSHWRALCGGIDLDSALLFNRDNSAVVLMPNGRPYAELIDRGGICQHCARVAEQIHQRIVWDIDLAERRGDR